MSASHLPLIVAHRGASHDAPENTLAAVQLAWDQKADAVEVDVQRTADDRLAVFHDPTLWRVTRQRRRIDSMTMAELARIDAGRWRGPRWRGERIPELDTVLDAVPAGRRLLVEIKGGPECGVAFARSVHRSRLDTAAVAAIGFSREALCDIKRRLPGVAVLWVVKFTRRQGVGRWHPPPGEPIHLAGRAGLDGLDVSARAPWSALWVEAVREAGLGLYVWTVDVPATARRLARLGVDGLTTNRPGWLRGQLGG